MKLEELKKLNEQEEPKELDNESEVEEESEESEEGIEEDPEQEEEESEDDDEPKDKKEPWQLTDEEESEDDEEVPLKTHLKIKGKLKGRLKDSEEENKRLKEENERLRSENKPLKRPLQEDFADDEEFNKALEEYEDAKLAKKISETRKTEQDAELIRKATQKRNDAVEKHYDRASKIISESGIEADNFRKADRKVREVVDSIMPGAGDPITDHFIELVGEGSEKVFYYLGVNENARNKFQSLLIEDKTGMKAAIYLGEQKKRLTQPSKIKSNAPAPAPKPKGDSTPSSSSVKKMKKAYDKVSGKSPQEAYNIKKKAKAAGVDVSKW